MDGEDQLVGIQNEINLIHVLIPSDIQAIVHASITVIHL